MPFRSRPVLRQPHGLAWVHPVQQLDRHLKTPTLQLKLEPIPPKRPGRAAAFEKVQSAWQALARARRDAATLRALITVHQHTYGPPALAGRPIPALTHPQDIRPWINDPSAVRQFFLELRPWWDEALVRDQNPLPAPCPELVADPFSHFHLGLVEEILETARTPLYVPLLILALPGSITACECARARQSLSLMPLSLEGEVTALVACSLQHGVGWWEAAQLASPVHSPIQFLQMAHAGGLLDHPCPHDIAHLIHYLKHTHHPAWTRVMGLLTHGLHPRTTVGWLRLRAQFPDLPPPTEPLLHQPDYRAMQRVLRRVPCVAFFKKRAARDQKALATRLWEAARHLEGFGQVLASIRPAWWRGDHMASLLYMLAGIWYFRSDYPNLMETRWKLLRPALPGLIRTLEQISPKWRKKAVEVCSELLVTAGMQITRRLIEVTPGLVRTLCAPPYSDSRSVADPLGRLFRRLPPSQLAVLSNNRGLLVQLEKASRTSHQSWWLEEGCDAMTDVPAWLYLPILQRCPARFVTILRRLGSLAEHARKEAWQMFEEHPLVSCNLETLPLSKVILMLDAIAIPGENPVPEKLRDHQEGRVVLSGHVLEHYREEMRQKTAEMQARVLLDLQDRVLQRSFPLVRNSPHVDPHTLIMSRSQVEQRRTVNRLIRMVASDPEARLHEDVANARWLNTLPARLRASWLEGFEVERDLPGIGRVVITPEFNLQERLKVGSYVSSCLSPGGACDYSAVAVTLDANKHVLYARNKDRKVVARQLVALTTDLRLVCFDVYPTRCSPEVQSLFETYDLTLAQHLRLPLHRGGEYEVANLHHVEWYDDGAMQSFT